MTNEPIFDALLREFAGREARAAVREGMSKPRKPRPRLQSETRRRIMAESTIHYAVSAS